MALFHRLFGKPGKRGPGPAPPAPQDHSEPLAVLVHQECVDALVLRGTGDWLMAADLIHVLVSVAGKKVEEDLREPGISVLRELLSSNLVRIGDVTESGFVPWQMPANDALARVDGQWMALGRNPTLGELFWLENTDSGDRRGDELLVSRRE